MARKLSESNIEQFTKAFLSKFRNANQRRAVRPFVEKAIKQIDFFLNPPCCDDPEASIEFSRRNNSLTQYISAILNNKVDRRKWGKSLQRTKDFLYQFLAPACCDTGDNSYSLTFVGTTGRLIISLDNIEKINVTTNGATDNIILVPGQSVKITLINFLTGFCLSFCSNIEVVVTNDDGDIIDTLHFNNCAGDTSIGIFTVEQGKHYAINGTVECSGS
jgi:hypothetical protein